MKLKHKSAQHDPNFKENLISHWKEEEMSVFLLGRGFDPVAQDYTDLRFPKTDIKEPHIQAQSSLRKENLKKFMVYKWVQAR